MILMPANHSSATVHYLAGRFPGRLGWLIGPTARFKTKLRHWIPYALDNDAFSTWSQGREWSEKEWYELLKWARMSGMKPCWALVPDVVADKQGTIDRWFKYKEHAIGFGWPLAFAVQDGMTPEDVPKDADVVFVGGTTEWKWRNLGLWTRQFRRVHVGRVNSLEKLWVCQDFGVESVDGTGWFRDSENSEKINRVVQWLSGIRNETMNFDF